MGVKNVTRKSVIATRSKIADSVLGRSIGLMFSLPTQSAMVLKFKSDSPVNLHMFFVFFPIDVILVDSRRKVVELIEGFAPFTTYSAKKKAMFVVEVPAGTIRKSKTKVGDEIAFFRVVEKKLKNGKSITVSKA